MKLLLNLYSVKLLWYLIINMIIVVFLKNRCNVIIHDIYATSNKIDADNSIVENIEFKISQFLSPKPFFVLPCN